MRPAEEKATLSPLQAATVKRDLLAAYAGAVLAEYADTPTKVEWRPELHPRGWHGRFGHGHGTPGVGTATPLGHEHGSGGGPAPLTDAEYREHTTRVEHALKAALDAGQSTDVRFGGGDGRGIWDPDRAEMHKQIVDELYAKATRVPSDGRGVLAGGLGGAGKSTVLRQAPEIDASQYLTINPDDVKEVMVKRGMVPEVPGLSPMEASPLVHEESSHVANLVAQRAYRDRKNVMWDITMSSQGSTQRRVAEMRKNGYTDLQGVFVDIPVETSVERALARHRRGLERYRAGQGAGGRYVPPAVIRKNSSTKASSANREAFDALRGQFDRWSVYDNSVVGRDPVLIDSGGKGARG